MRALFIPYVEETLPTFMVFGTQLRMNRLGYPQTPGIMAEFRAGMRESILKVPITVKRDVQDIVKMVANELSDGFDADDPRDLLLGVLAFVAMLGENGLWNTLDHVLCKLCLQEINDFKILGQWRTHDRWVMDTAVAIMMRARNLGLYLRGQSVTLNGFRAASIGE